MINVALGWEETPCEPWLECADEVMIMMFVLSMAFSNLKAEVRRTISTSDASATGGGAAEASRFVARLARNRAEAVEDIQARLVD